MVATILNHDAWDLLSNWDYPLTCHDIHMPSATRNLFVKRFPVRTSKNFRLSLPLTPYPLSLLQHKVLDSYKDRRGRGF